MAKLIWQGKHNIEQQALSNKQMYVVPSAQLQTIETFTNPLPAASSQPISSPTHTWHNRLICGDKNEVLPALVQEFSNSINLIYIDPPFMTGRDFTSGSQLAYSDKWRNNLDVYLQWLYETFALLHLLLAEHGSLYVRLDWHATHYAKIIMDEIFGISPNAEGAGF